MKTILHVVAGNEDTKFTSLQMSELAEVFEKAMQSPSGTLIVTRPGIIAYHVPSLDPEAVRPDLAGVYKHYKGGIYEVVMISRREEDQVTLVSYRSLDPKKTTIWTRTEGNFTGGTFKVDKDSSGNPTSDGIVYKRFTKIEVPSFDIEDAP